MQNNIFKYSINDGFLCSEVTLKGEKAYFIEGYASTIDKDKSGEIVDMSAQQDILNQTLNENITMDIEHEEWYDAQGKLLPKPKNEKIPVARVVHAELRPLGVWVKAQINSNLKNFSELWGSIKDGFLKAFSIAFYPTQKMGNVVKHLNLVNITLTGSPVNPNATFSVCMKSASAWLDQQNELKAKNPSLTNPADTASLSNPADSYSVDSFKTTEIKSEDDTMEEDEKKKKTSDEEEEEKKKKKKSSEGKEEEKKADEKKEDKPEVKSEEKQEEKSDSLLIDVKAQHDAEVKTLTEKYEAALKAKSDEVAALKAELERPIMKSTVEKKMPDTTPAFAPLSPLQMIR